MKRLTRSFLKLKLRKKVFQEARRNSDELTADFQAMPEKAVFGRHILTPRTNVLRVNRVNNPAKPS
jgi:hypothetical protein